MMLSAILLCTTLAQAPIRLIVQGDDMGAAHSINLGTIKAYKEGIMRTANFMVPTPWLPEAVQLLNENPGLDAGIHLTMTSEWSLVKWRPLTTAPSFTDLNGYLFPTVRPALIAAQPKLAEVEKELRAQIEMGKRLVPRVSYMTTHMGFSGPFPEIQELLKKLSAEYKLVIPNVQYLRGIYTQADSAEARIAKIVQRLETLEAGTWLMLDHAALDTPEMRAIHHPGYENVAEDRSAVVAAWTSPKVKEVVERRKIELSGHSKKPL